MQQVVEVSLENVDRIRGSIKVLEKEEDLWKWLAHTKKMVAKVRGLGEDSDLLETLIGGKIIHEKMKKKFLEGNVTGEGFTKLETYLELGLVQEVILKRERACIQMDMVSGERLELVMYVERKYSLLLAKEKTFRDNEANSWAKILKLIKTDMCTDDLILLTPFATGADTYGKYIDACEEAEAIIIRKKEETKRVAAVKVVKEEEKGENDKKEKKFKKPQFRNDKTKFEGKCNWCLKKGHMESNCWSKQRGEPKNDIRGSFEINIKCYNCGEKGHIAKACVKEREQEEEDY